MIRENRHRFVPAIVAGGIVLALTLLLCIGIAMANHQSKPSTPSGMLFYEVVVDQDGLPVAGAEIRARATRLRPNPIIAGGMVPSKDDARAVTAISHGQGRVTITLTEGLRKQSTRRTLQAYATMRLKHQHAQNNF